MPSFKLTPMDGTMIEISLAGTDLDGASLGARTLQTLGITDGPPSKLLSAQSIAWEHTLEAIQPKGTGQVAVYSYTPGVIDYGPGAVELWETELTNWINAYGGPMGWHNHTFDVVITYRLNIGLPVQEIKLIGCRPQSVTHNHSTQTSENLTGFVTFYIGSITYSKNTGAIAGAAAVSVAGNLF